MNPVSIHHNITYFLYFLFFLFQYSVYSCILALIVCGVFLRVSFELKVAFLFIACAIYYIMILCTHSDLFKTFNCLLWVNDTRYRLSLSQVTKLCRCALALSVLTKMCICVVQLLLQVAGFL